MQSSTPSLKTLGDDWRQLAWDCPAGAVSQLVEPGLLKALGAEVGGSGRTGAWGCVLHRQEMGEQAPAKSVLKQHKNGLSARLAAEDRPLTQ